MVNGKYTLKVRTAIDEYWRVNHHPPTIRDLMSMCDLPSTSHTRYIVKSFSDVRLAKHGRIIPEWVDKLFLPNKACSGFAAGRVKNKGSVKAANR